MEIVPAGVVVPSPVVESEPKPKTPSIGAINHVLKYASISLGTFALFIWLVSKILLHPDNMYLSFFGVQENIGQKYERLVATKLDKLQENNLLTGEVQILQNQIENANFYDHPERIDFITNQQKHWIDTVNNKGEVTLGMIDFTKHIQRYFNEGHFEHKILFSSGNTIHIRNFIFKEDQATFTINASNFFGNVFLLSSEVINIINGLPQFEDGKILNFYRHTEKNGSDTMSFTLNVKTQTHDDPNDQNPSSLHFWQWVEQEILMSPL